MILGQKLYKITTAVALCYRFFICSEILRDSSIF
nr:MAG TPA: hypothetical protein [Caudoviricetes sp.]